MTIPLGDVLVDQQSRNLGGVVMSRETRQAFGSFKLSINEGMERFAKAVEEDRYGDATEQLDILSAAWKQGMQDYGIE